MDKWPGTKKRRDAWEDAEFVLRQIMNGITKVMAEVREYKKVGERQQGGRRSPKSVGQMAAKIKVLTQMVSTHIS